MCYSVPYQQEVVKCMNDAAERLKDRNSNATGSALKLLTKALSISLYSEKLLQMKAEALYLVFSIPNIFPTLIFKHSYYAFLLLLFC